MNRLSKETRGGARPRRGGAALVVFCASALVACSAQAEETAEAVFAGGCFWCTESDFEKVEGVIEAVSGYSGGTLVNPTYRQVTGGGTGHFEAVRVTYDPARVSYETLVAYFWRTIDPTDDAGQFCDKGSSYRTAIFVADADERAAVEASKLALEASGDFAVIATEVRDAAPFYPAEAYHQDFYKTNPLRYGSYRLGCGRDARLKSLWGAEAGGASVLAAATD